jgi:hypothetical protein
MQPGDDGLVRSLHLDLAAPLARPARRPFIARGFVLR